MPVSGVRVYLQPGVTGVCNLFTRPLAAPGISSLNPGPDSSSTAFVDAVGLEYLSFWQPLSETPPTAPPGVLYEDGYAQSFPVWNGAQGAWGYCTYFSNNQPEPPQWPYSDVESIGWDDYDSVRLQQIEALLHPNTEVTNYPVSNFNLVSLDNGVIQCPEAYGIDITIFTDGNANSWYGMADCAKFGVVSAQYDNQYFGPLQWINWTNQRIILAKEGVCPT
jgi:hypothetical protein